MPNSSFMS